MGICFVMTPVWFKVGRFFFVFWSVSLLISKPKHLHFNKNVLSKPLKVCRIHSHRVEIRLRKIHSQRCRSQSWGFFAYIISGERSTNGPKKLQNDAFKSKQVGLPKISSILQKVKIGQKPIYAHFAWRPSITKDSTSPFFADALYATEKTIVAPAIHSIPVAVRQESVLSGII